ncbi:hypothetical protein KCU93_g7779, partial [Aureobasidium melanogenum]
MSLAVSRHNSANTNKSPADPHAALRIQACAANEPLYGTISISLLSRGKAVGLVQRDHLAPIMRKGLLAALNENESHVYKNLGLTTICYETAADERVAVFLAHWVNTRDTAGSIAVCLGPELTEDDDNISEILSLFHLVANYFSNMDRYISDIFDSLVDWFIIWLQKNENKGINEIFDSCMDNECRMRGGLMRVYANVFANYGSGFTARKKDRFKLWLGNHLQDNDTIPGDVLSIDFDQFCAYHEHGEQDCYREKCW